MEGGLSDPVTPRATLGSDVTPSGSLEDGLGIIAMLIFGRMRQIFTFSPECLLDPTCSRSRFQYPSFIS